MTPILYMMPHFGSPPFDAGPALAPYRLRVLATDAPEAHEVVASAFIGDLQLAEF